MRCEGRRPHLHREAREVDLCRIGRRDVEELAERRLVGHLVEEVHQRDVEGGVAEVLLQDHVDVRLEQDPVVDRVEAHAVHLVPARLAAPRLRRVHHVVGDEEEGLEPLDAPAEDARAVEVLLAHLPLDRAHRLHHRQAAVQLSERHVVLHQTLEVGRGGGGEVVAVDVGEDIGGDLLEPAQEVRPVVHRHVQPRRARGHRQRLRRLGQALGEDARGTRGGDEEEAGGDFERRPTSVRHVAQRDAARQARGGRAQHKLHRIAHVCDGHVDPRCSSAKGGKAARGGRPPS